MFKFIPINDGLTDLDIPKIQKIIKEEFGSDVNSSSNCYEVSKYIYDNLIEDKENAKVLSNFVLYKNSDDGFVDIISVRGHTVLKYKDSLYDFTNNQYEKLRNASGVRVYQKLSDKDYASGDIHINL